MQRCTASMPHLHSQQVVLCSTTRHCTHTHHTLATAHQGEPVLGTAEPGQVGMAAWDRVEELHVTVQTMQPLKECYRQRHSTQSVLITHL